VSYKAAKSVNVYCMCAVYGESSLVLTDGNDIKLSLKVSCSINQRY